MVHLPGRKAWIVTMESTAGRTKCVVLAPNATSVDGQLRSQLEQRQWDALVTDVPLMAMAELCLAQRMQSSRTAWGLTSADGVVLVVIEPSHWLDLSVMLRAIKRYVPVVGAWAFEDGTMRCITEADRDKVLGRVTPPPKTRPDDDEDRASEALDPQVTHDEIAMLLRDENQEPGE